MSDAPAIELHGLTKDFGRFRALDGASAVVPRGRVGLLGPNGAGKSTLVKCLLGLVRPSAGRASVLGVDTAARPLELRRRVGYVPEVDCHVPGMSGAEFVAYMGELCGMPSRAARTRAHEVLEWVGLGEERYRPVDGYSFGMRQRVKLAQALLHKPELLILDEPLTGADPLGRRELRGLIAGLAREGTHVLLSSHVLHEVEELTQRVVLIHRGRVVADGQIEEIRALLDEHPHRLLVRCERPRAVASALLGASELQVVGLELTAEDRLVLETRAPAACYAALPQLLLDQGGELHELRAEDEDLDAVFRYLVRG